MTLPLAIMACERLLPCSQMGQRLEDLGYRVLTVTDLTQLTKTIVANRPMVVIVDLESEGAPIPAMIASLRQAAGTEHIPVLAFGRAEKKQQQEAAREAGAALVAGEEAILGQLPQLLEQVLEVR